MLLAKSSQQHTTMLLLVASVLHGPLSIQRMDQFLIRAKLEIFRALFSWRERASKSRKMHARASIKVARYSFHSPHAHAATQPPGAP